MSTNLRNKILGSIVGFAIGDAMGATTEFMTPDEIRRCYGRVTEIIGGGWLDLKPGETTDDTQMMMQVAAGMIEGYPSIGAQLNAICRNFVEWLDSGPKDVGNTCRTAIMDNRYFFHGYQWSQNNIQRQRNTNHQDLGNGGLMRCLVPCLTGSLSLAVAQSNLTHSNSTCVKAVREYYGVLQKCLTRTPYEPTPHGKPSGMVTNTLNNAIYWSSYPFNEGILGAVNDGGDADTIAALAGGLLGAKTGYIGILRECPSWVSALDKSLMEELNDLADYITKVRK